MKTTRRSAIKGLLALCVAPPSLWGDSAPSALPAFLRNETTGEICRVLGPGEHPWAILLEAHQGNLARKLEEHLLFGSELINPADFTNPGPPRKVRLR